MHINYIYNYASGKWRFSTLDPLIKLSIVVRDTSESTDINWRDYIAEDNIEEYDSIIENLIKTSGSSELTYYVKTIDNNFLEFSDYCSVIKPENAWPVLAGCLMPTLYRNEELLTAERRIITGELAVGMVHDMKNILSGMTNMLEFCISKLQDDNEIYPPLQKTLHCTEEAARLISGALLLSRGINIEDNFEDISIEDVINSMEPLIRCILPASIILEIKISQDIPHLFCNRSLLYDLLLNLCLNARDAMKNKGNILRITAEETDKKNVPETAIGKKKESNDEKTCDRYIKITVEDNGCGMDEATRNSVFNAFFSTKSTGTGLGLWMVKETILNQLHGMINIDSVYGKGTKFELFLPVGTSLNKYTANLSTFEESGNKKVDKNQENEFSSMYGITVLFVEDETLIRTGIASSLERIGINVLSAADGEEALQLFMKHKDSIDLVIEDYFVPKRRGDELIKIFRSYKKSIPVILTSAESDHTTLDDLSGLQADELIEKPFKTDKLIKLIKKVLNSGCTKKPI